MTTKAISSTFSDIENKLIGLDRLFKENSLTIKSTPQYAKFKDLKFSSVSKDDLKDFLLSYPKNNGAEGNDKDSIEFADVVAETFQELVSQKGFLGVNLHDLWNEDYLKRLCIEGSPLDDQPRKRMKDMMMDILTESIGSENPNELERRSCQSAILARMVTRERSELSADIKNLPDKEKKELVSYLYRESPNSENLVNNGLGEFLLASGVENRLIQSHENGKNKKRIYSVDAGLER